MIKAIETRNFKRLSHFSLDLNEHLNVLVGNNEAGKSTVLEAINLALTRRYEGRAIDFELSPYLFSKEAVASYLSELKQGKNPALPKIEIELYFADDCGLDQLRGRNNLRKEDGIGVRLEISFNDEHVPEYTNLIAGDRKEINLIPVEYYTVKWTGFDGNSITRRTIDVGLSYIDATTIRLQSGTDYYLRDIVQGTLDPKDQIALSVAYRGLKEQFSKEDAIRQINERLPQGEISSKPLEISIDISQRTSWEAHLTPHLDELPFQYIGKGEQSALKVMLALSRKAEESQIILIEEPENHLSFSMMRALIDRIDEKCTDKQIIIATHSAYVINKLGLDGLVLIDGCNIAKLSNLPADTQKYFKKLSGYDTLRLVLAKKAILVEGPSDELVVQKAYLKKHGKMPIDDEIDVINVNGLSFKRFLDIAKELGRKVVVVTDNDGDYQHKVVEKYAEYEKFDNITICSDDDLNYPTLEPQMVKANSLDVLNSVLSTDCANEDEIISYMQSDKTECALKIFDTESDLSFPKYIEDAIS